MVGDDCGTGLDTIEADGLAFLQGRCERIVVAEILTDDRKVSMASKVREQMPMDALPALVRGDDHWQLGT